MCGGGGVRGSGDVVIFHCQGVCGNISLAYRSSGEGVCGKLCCHKWFEFRVYEHSFALP